MSGIHYLRSVSVPSAGVSVAHLLSGCLGLSSPWLVVASYVPSVYLCPRTLLSWVPPQYFPLTFPVPLYPPLLPLPTVYVSTLTQVPRSAVERLNTPTLGGNFELPNYFTSPIIIFLSPTSLPQCGCGVSCLSTIAYLYSIGYLRLIQLPPTCEINSLKWMPEFKAYKVTCSSSASLM